jgi:hypothetical protein
LRNGNESPSPSWQTHGILPRLESFSFFRSTNRLRLHEKVKYLSFPGITLPISPKQTFTKTSTGIVPVEVFFRKVKVLKKKNLLDSLPD